MAVMTNQLLMDGSVKGMYELDFLTRKRQFTVPNSVVNMQLILSKSGDGYNSDLFNKEKNRFRQSLQREVGDFAYSINAKKVRQRAPIVKRWSTVLQKMQTSSQKPELKLRLLRSFRIKLLHSYCKEVLKEVYNDSFKVQIL